VTDTKPTLEMTSTTIMFFYFELKFIATQHKFIM